MSTIVERVPTITKTIEVFVCPEPECTSYYGSSSMGDLSSELTYAKPETKDVHDIRRKVRHTRANCPNCRQNGKANERVLVKVKVQIPAETGVVPDIPEYE